MKKPVTSGGMSRNLLSRRSLFGLSMALGSGLGIAGMVRGGSASDGKAGMRLPPEGRTYTDRRTDAEVRQVTSVRCVNHHPYLFVPGYDDSMRRLIFISHRTGRPEIYAEERQSGDLIQVTCHEGISEWSINPSHDGAFVYYLAGTTGWRVHLETFEREQIIDFGEIAMREKGMIAAALGTTGLSYCDRWWAIPVKVGEQSQLVLLDTETKQSEVILTRDTIGHPQFCPDDSNWILYAGPLHDRTWVLRRDGTENRRLYKRKPKEWIAHEVWIPTRREVSFVDWPHGIRAIYVESGKERRVTSFNAWHATANRNGDRMVADTNFPDIGLQIFDPTDGIGEPDTLCFPEASSIGEHWDGPFPYADGPVKVYAPQQTHPHPQFSPDGSKVLYTSDRSGFPQVYEVSVEKKV